MKNIVRLLLVQLVVSHVWVAAQDCGAILTEPSGSFSSANFPGHYANNSNCTWILFTQPDNTISLTFDAFVLDTSDYVTVFDGPSSDSPVLLRHTGYTIPATVRSSVNIMSINFASNDQITYSGFMALYASSLVSTTSSPTTATPLKPTCGGTLYWDGRIVSPDYPAQYADQAYCVWYLQSSSQSSITLQFDTFSTEAKVDVVSIYEDWEMTDRPLQTFSGEYSEPLTVTSTKTNRFLVTFISDGSISGSGFLASFN